MDDDYLWIINHSYELQKLTTANSYTDNELLQQLSQGNRNAFEIIYRKYWRLLLDAAWKRLKDKQSAEDLVQSVFLSLWQKREQLQVENLEAYLRTAVRYKVLNHVVRTKRTYAFFEPLQEILLEENTPETALLTKNIQQLIHAYAATLPEKRREIFLLHIQSRLTTKEIAEKLGISQKTVQNQLGAALQGLRTRIAPIIIYLVMQHF